MMHTSNLTNPLPYPSGGMVVGGPGGMVLPTALLEQYPALATMNWDAGGGGGGLSGAEGSGRSSFDASAEEYDEDDDWDEQGGMSGAGSHRSSFDGGERSGWGSDSGSHWLPQRTVV